MPCWGVDQWTQAFTSREWGVHESAARQWEHAWRRWLRCAGLTPGTPFAYQCRTKPDIVMMNLDVSELGARGSALSTKSQHPDVPARSSQAFRMLGAPSRSST